MEELYELLSIKSLGMVYTEGGQLDAGGCDLWNFFAGAAPVEQFRTDQIEWITIGANKDPGRFNTRGAAPKRVQLANMSKSAFTLFRTDNEIELPVSVLDMLRHPEQWAYQDKGMEVIREQLRYFGSLGWYNKFVTLSKMLNSGVMYLDGDGDILESSSGALQTIDWGVPSYRKTQLAKLGNGVGASGNIIGTAWDSTSATILNDLDTIREAAEATNSEQPRHVWMHTVAKEWIRNNTQIKGFYSAIERLDNALRGNTFEINDWVFHFNAQTYTAADGTKVPFVDKTKAVITPDVGPWFKHAVGRELIAPLYGSRGVAGDGLEAVASAVREAQEVYGDFATVDLIRRGGYRVVLESGCNYGYYFANPKSVFMPTVDF